ncbi:MAG: hypothetical protein BWX64_02667 [Acidobacteria bacterium ADurb.Bin051]|nr:MAG: hypothetical protein BWX64_02667 [Acidobacteria bacterium ADurb.Bin051]
MEGAGRRRVGRSGRGERRRRRRGGSRRGRGGDGRSRCRPRPGGCRQGRRRHHRPEQCEGGERAPHLAGRGLPLPGEIGDGTGLLAEPGDKPLPRLPEAQAGEREERLGVEGERLSGERREPPFDHPGGREAGHPGEHELRQPHLEGGVARGRLAHHLEPPLAPVEDVEELLGERLLEGPEETGAVDHPALDQHLADQHAAGGRGLQRLLVPGLVEPVLLHEEAPEGLMEEVRAAVHRHPAFEEDPLVDVAAAQPQLDGALGEAVGEQQDRERHRGQLPRGEGADLQQLVAGEKHGRAPLRTRRD